MERKTREKRKRKKRKAGGEMEVVEILTDRRLGKIEASLTVEGRMPTTNSNTPTAHAKTVSETTTMHVTSLAMSCIMVVVLTEVKIEVEHEAGKVVMAVVLAVESEI